MRYWLYHEILQVDPDRQPSFALQSTTNWAAALASEITAEHGADAPTQLISCRQRFKNNLLPRPAAARPAEVFEPLVAAITGAMTLRSLSLSSLNQPWSRPSTVVTWYYSVYAAARSMVAALDQGPAKTHAATRKAYVASLRRHLPHPFDMLARRTQGEEYSPALPSCGVVQPYDLSRSFSSDRHTAQGMLLQYLSGTAQWYADDVKDRLRAKAGLPNFRTAQARQLRDQSLEPEIGFLHCAYRYRGKANYRDAIYLSYGLREPAEGPRFTSNLAAVASFSALMAVAFVERRLGRQEVLAFLLDLRQFLRGLSTAQPEEAFWTAAIP
jgi:hypothetical protein